MGINLSFDKSRSVRLATNTGWSDLVDWARTLPIKLYPHLTHLVYYGFSRNISILANETIEAERRFPIKDSTVKMTVKHMIQVMNQNRNSDMAIISNGIVQSPQKNPPTY